MCMKYVHKKRAAGLVSESKCPFEEFLDFPANKFKRIRLNAGAGYAGRLGKDVPSTAGDQTVSAEGQSEFLVATNH